MTAVGCVYIVGTGPGDPALLTVRGRQKLAAADVVVADPGLHPRLLGWARPDAERIDVPAAAPGAGERTAIDGLLADRAGAGRTVARLLRGDPLASGEAAAAARSLHARGIRFEVVPGVTPHIAAPGLAGCSVAEPEAAPLVVVSEGGADAEREAAVDWSRLAPLPATIVAEGGGASLGRIADALVRHGRSPEEPATLVLDGTLPAQDVVEGSLRNARDASLEMADSATAVLVVGRSSRRPAALRWFDRRPLGGRRVLVTRPRAQAAAFVDLLADLGADPVEAPMIRIAPPEDDGPLEAACAAAATFDWIVFTSANGVDAFLERLLTGARDVRALGTSRLCAIGPATSARLRRHGLKADLVPDEHRGEAVGAALAREQDLAGARILLPRADIARAALPDALRRAGAEVVDVAAYRTLPAGAAEGAEVARMLRRRDLDVVTFTSASTVRSFVDRLRPESAAELLAGVAVASIGPVTAEAARRLGIDTSIMPATYTGPALAQAIAAHFGSAGR